MGDKGEKAIKIRQDKDQGKSNPGTDCLLLAACARLPAACLLACLLSFLIYGRARARGIATASGLLKFQLSCVHALYPYLYFNLTLCNRQQRTELDYVGRYLPR